MSCKLSFTTNFPIFPSLSRLPTSQMKRIGSLPLTNSVTQSPETLNLATRPNRGASTWQLRTGFASSSDKMTGFWRGWLVNETTSRKLGFTRFSLLLDISSVLADCVKDAPPYVSLSPCCWEILKILHNRIRGQGREGVGEEWRGQHSVQKSVHTDKRQENMEFQFNKSLCTVNFEMLLPYICWCHEHSTSCMYFYVYAVSFPYIFTLFK